MLLLVSSVKLIAEIALMALAGRWLVGILAGGQRDSNVFYRVLDVLSKPFVKGARVITPRFVIDRHVPLAAFGLLCVVWLFSLLMKVQLCLQVGMQQCR
jgi:hypothetical protein